ncbi:MAG: T9SS type A sorting domain-containing protein [Bacteroidetes bacterium]|nr:T9SS type A sorting domain-containing protein [Bacteroidota bacterium]
MINIQSDFDDDKVVITDLTGKCISSLKISVGNNLLNIQNLLPGLYFLRTKIGVEKVF